MDERMPGASWLHRLLGKQPGTVPKWLLESGGCEGDAVSTTCLVCALAVVAGVVAAGIYSGLIDKTRTGVIVIASMASVITICLLVDQLFFEPCRTVERKARAIARRQKASAGNLAVIPPDTPASSN